MSIAALDADRMIATAVAATGLHDWGGEEFRAPFSSLVRALNEEAALNEVGRARAHHWLQLRLEQRLRMVEDRRRRPEISRQVIDRPVFVTGLPRAGTTYLHALLATDPANLAPRLWQLLRPSPLANDPALDHSAQIHAGRDFLGFMGWNTPEMLKMHDFDAEAPEECFFAFEFCFISMGFIGYWHIPSYMPVLAGDFAPAYAMHRNVLQALQVGAENRRWVLKAPEHTTHLRELFAAYPDATLVQNHRDPSTVIASVLSLLTANHRLFTDRPPHINRDFALGFMQVFAAGLEYAIRLRDDPALAGRVVDVHYRDLVRQPLAVVERIYAHAGMTFTSEAHATVQRLIDARRQNRHGKHRYRLTDYGLTADDVRSIFKTYIERYDIELEDHVQD